VESDKEAESIIEWVLVVVGEVNKQGELNADDVCIVDAAARVVTTTPSVNKVEQEGKDNLVATVIIDNSAFSSAAAVLLGLLTGDSLSDDDEAKDQRAARQFG